MSTGSRFQCSLFIENLEYWPLLLFPSPTLDSFLQIISLGFWVKSFFQKLEIALQVESFLCVKWIIDDHRPDGVSGAWYVWLKACAPCPVIRSAFTSSHNCTICASLPPGAYSQQIADNTQQHIGGELVCAVCEYWVPRPFGRTLLECPRQLLHGHWTLYRTFTVWTLHTLLNICWSARQVDRTRCTDGHIPKAWLIPLQLLSKLSALHIDMRSLLLISALPADHVVQDQLTGKTSWFKESWQGTSWLPWRQVLVHKA